MDMNAPFRVGALAAFAVLALTACGDDPEAVGPDTTEDAGAGSEPSGTAAAPLTVATPPEEFEFADDPSALSVSVSGYGNLGVPAIAADGRVFTVRDTGIHGFAAPAMVPPMAPPTALDVSQLTDEGMDELRRRIVDAGLNRNDVDYGEAMITDHGTTTVTIVSATETYEHSVYALSAGTGDERADAARARLDDFATWLAQLPGSEWVASTEPYEPVGWMVMSGSSRSGDSVEWPFDLPPADGTCLRADDLSPEPPVAPGEGQLYHTEEQRFIVLVPTMPWDAC